MKLDMTPMQDKGAASVRAAVAGLSWISIIRLGLVQAAMGGIVALTTSTLNRVLVVELGLAALVPGLLVGIHYAVQLVRPVIGYGVDRNRSFTPWIIGGMALLALGGGLAAYSARMLVVPGPGGFAVAVFAFLLIGFGVGIAGTTILAMIARGAAPARRPAAATIAWVLMIAGIIASTATAAQMLDPFSLDALLNTAVTIGASAFLVACLALWGVERRTEHMHRPVPNAEPTPTQTPTSVPASASTSASASLVAALAEICRERHTFQFTVFVFLSMLAYSAQDLILEPYAGLVFGLTVGESTMLGAVQHQGVLVGMIVFGCIGGLAPVRRHVPLIVWTLVGCVISAISLALIAVGGLVGGGLDGGHWPIQANVVLLGFGNGIFAVGAIGTMLSLAGDGQANREGTRVGLWGAAQAVAFATGGFVGTGAVDLLGLIGFAHGDAYAFVFLGEAALFLVSAHLAMTVVHGGRSRPSDKSAAESLGQGILTLETYGYDEDTAKT